MKYSKILYLAILFSIVSCDQEKKRMIKGLSKTYSIDTTAYGSHIPPNIGMERLKLILSADGTYRFAPNFSILQEYVGTWDLSSADGNFVFQCKNGVNEINPTLFIDFIYKKKRITGFVLNDFYSSPIAYLPRKSRTLQRQMF